MPRKPTKRLPKTPTKKPAKRAPKKLVEVEEKPPVVTVDDNRPTEKEAWELAGRMTRYGMISLEQQREQVTQILTWTREAFNAASRMTDKVQGLADVVKVAPEPEPPPAEKKPEEEPNKYEVLEKLEALVLVRQAAHFRAQRELARANEMLRKASDHVASGNEDMTDFRAFFNNQVGIRELNIPLCLKDSDEMTRALFDMEPYHRERPKFGASHGRMGITKR